ncbi:MAG: hypothetical protein ACOYW7_05215 [Nitrospirota bacterium]
MRTDVPEKLLNIISDIEEEGPQNLTRLAVLKRWLSDPDRLASFAVFIGKRAASKKGKAKGHDAVLFKKASALFKSTPVCNPRVTVERAEQLLEELSDYQREYKEQKWGRVRAIKNWNLHLIENGLRIYLRDRDNPSLGYRLAVKYCQSYDPAYGTMLDNSSVYKLEEIVRFMFKYEALCDFQ